MSDGEDINDVFDAISFSEEALIEVGYKEGFQKGSLEGRKEGFHLGLHKGREIGQELGFYQGFAEAWIRELEKSKEKKNEKTLVQLEKLVNLIKQIPDHNTKEVDLAEQIRQVQGRFKTVCSMLRVSSELAGSDISW